MTDDIVTQLRAGGRSRPEPLLCDIAADEIERLREYVAAARREIVTLRQYVAALQDDRQTVGNQNAAMRAAGDQLHAWVTVNATTSQQERAGFDKVITAWERACRG